MNGLVVQTLPFSTCVFFLNLFFSGQKNWEILNFYFLVENLLILLNFSSNF
jgi:hypothetical protein